MPPRRPPEATDALRTSLVEHARRLVQREGPAALTMRSLAAEAGCSVGLPYTVFEGRDELVAEVVHLEFRRLRGALDAWKADAGRRTVAQNLARYAAILLDGQFAPAFVHADEIGDAAFEVVLAEKAEESGLLAAFESTVAEYLLAEQRLGRVAARVDAAAYGFLITGAVHNLLVSGPAYPRPTARRLRRHFAAIAEHVAP